MIAEVGDADKILNISFEDLPDSSSPNITVDEYLQLMIDKARALLRASTDDHIGKFYDARHRARLAFHISMCYLLPVGTSFDLQTGLKWLLIAAYGGHQFAIVFAALLRRSYKGTSRFEAPMKLFQSISALAGSHRALDVLREENFSQYEIIVRILQQKSSSPGRLDGIKSAPYFLDILLSYQEGENLKSDTMDLLTALKSHNISIATELLEKGDASVVNDRGAGAMHYLSLLADETGADLAFRCFQNGARLDLESMDENIMHMRVASGTPLKWAALKGRTMLLSVLLDLHEEHYVPILDYDAVLATLTIDHHANSIKALLDFKIQNPALCTSQLDPDVLFPKNLLLVAMDSRDMGSLERQLYHGSSSQKAYEETVSLLLDQGADPTEGFSTDCPFYRALQQDDDIPLRIFVMQISKYQSRPLNYLADPGHYSQIPEAKMHTALQTCIYSKSFRCFKILLESFPELMEMRNARGLTALHSASYFEENLPMLRLLLEKGAKVLVWSKDRSTPLFKAWRNHNLEAADLMSEQCSPEEMEKLLTHDEITGFSAMSKLMSPWLSGRSPALLESFQWIANHGGAHFIGEKKPDERAIENPIWNPVLCRANPLTPSQAALDTRLLEMLLNMFSDKLEYIQYDGRAPLHLAVWYCKPEVVRMLIDRGVNINLEFGRSRIHSDPVEAERRMGKTALNYAILRMEAVHLPDVVKRGGAVEINRFRKAMRGIVQMLVDHGAKVGSRSTLSKSMEALTFQEPGSRIHVQSSNEPEPLAHDRFWVGDWPSPLPRDETSLPEPDLKKMNKGIQMVKMLTGAMSDEIEENKRKEEEDRLPNSYRQWVRATVEARSFNRRAPEGWEARVALTPVVRVFYVDHKTKSTTWVRPEIKLVVRPVPGSGSEQFPSM